MKPGVRNLLIAVVAVVLFAAAFGVTALALSEGSEDSNRTESAPSAASPDAAAEDDTLDDVGELCARVNAIHDQEPAGELEGYAFMRDELRALSDESSPRLQAILSGYIEGFTLLAAEPAQGQDTLDANRAVLDGRQRLNEACIEVGAPGYG